jgi:ATP-binding cassette, subfamily B, bacterial MsbA
MKEYIEILNRFPAYPKVLILSSIAGIVEGLGLSLFIPVINLASGGSSQEIPWPLDGLNSALEYLGISGNLVVLNIFVLVILTLAFYISFYQKITIANSKMMFQHQLRTELTKNLFNATWEFHKSQTTGDVINRLTVQVDRASSCMTYQVLTLSFAIQAAVYLLLSLALSPVLTMVVFSMLIVMAFGANLITHNVTKLGFMCTFSHTNYSSKINEYIGGFKILTVMAASEVILNRLKRLSHAIQDSYVNEERSQAFLAFYMRVGPIIIISGIVIVSFEFLGMEGATVLVFLFVLIRLVPAVTAVRQNYHSYKIHKPSLDITNKLNDAALSAGSQYTGSDNFSAMQESIVLKDVCYRFDDSNKDVLKNISLKIKKNTTIGIVGGSGSGKTTLLDLIVGLYKPTKGTIKIDGKDLQSLNSSDWRKSIGYVNQDVLMFNESLRDNILIRNEKASSDEIEMVVKTSFLKKVLDRLEFGLDSNIGEKGVRLSGGERQRIALARALLSSPSIIVLDEATSALDAESENIIQERIDAISHNYTIIIVTHRLSTVRNSDYIYVMEKGEIIEHGKYNDLLEKSGRLTELHNLQAAK